MRALIPCAMALALTACSAAQMQQGATSVNTTVASAQPTIEMACWLVAAADSGFQIYAASAKADTSVVADEAKAMAGANAICANPPSNAASAIADVLAAYKAVVAVTPAG